MNNKKNLSDPQAVLIVFGAPILMTAGFMLWINREEQKNQPLPSRIKNSFSGFGMWTAAAAYMGFTISTLVALNELGVISIEG
ncbi:MAG: hypothetical protein AAB649_05860 [Patescibacteria group bacterium]